MSFPHLLSCRLPAIGYLLSVGLMLNFSAVSGPTQPIPDATNPDPVLEAGDRPIRFNLEALTHPAQMQRRGAPGGRAGAGTRGDCPALAATTPNLTAIVPTVTSPEGSSPIAIGTTTQTRPTVTVYIPYATSTIETIKLVVLDDADNPLLSHPLEIQPEKLPGLVNIQFPEAASLEIGRYYRWYVLIDCQPLGSSDVFVSSLIQRVPVDPTFAHQLANANPRERINLYAQEGIWHDALMELQAQNSSNISTLSADWESLLESIGLDTLGPVTTPKP